MRKTETKYGWNVDGSYSTPISASFLPNVSRIPVYRWHGRDEVRSACSATVTDRSLTEVHSGGECGMDPTLCNRNVSTC